MSGQVLGGDSWLRQAGALCSTPARLNSATGGYDSTLGPIGRTGATFTTPCSAGYAITGIYGRSGGWVDQAGFKCSKLNDVKSTIDLQDGFTAQISNVRIGTATGPSTTLSAGQSFQLSLNYFAKDTNCPGCMDQIVIGYVSSDPTVAQQPNACVYAGVPGASGVSGSSTVTLSAPTQPGTYTIRAHYGQGLSCDPGYWWNIHGTPGPNAIIAEFQIN